MPNNSHNVMLVAVSSLTTPEMQAPHNNGKLIIQVKVIKQDTRKIFIFYQKGPGGAFPLSGYPNR